MARTTLAIEIDAWLPQTQCTRCGFPRCRDYAEALARGEADINRCPPGGSVTLHALARLLDVPAKPLDPACGAEGPRTQAVIDETQCIGCRKCIDACPVDAIVGAPKLMHTVIAELCTGCELCVPSCPVDCIALVPQTVAGNPWKVYRREDAARWRALNERRVQRLARRRKQTGFAQHVTRSIETKETERGRIRAEIREAVARVRRKRANLT